MIFETQDRGPYPPQMASLERTLGWTESEYQSGPDRIVKSSRRWITSSPFRVDHFLSVANTGDSSQNEQSWKVAPHPIASHRRNVQSVVLAAGPWLLTQTREEGKPLLALHPSTDNDDYRVVTFLDEATRCVYVIVARGLIRRSTFPSSRCKPAPQRVTTQEVFPSPNEPQTKFRRRLRATSRSGKLINGSRSHKNRSTLNIG
jgi:hypothetical protein